MQIILQATHGIVSGSPTFFKRAFGKNPAAFEKLLMKPHEFIFNRVWFEELGGAAELEEYETMASRLSASDRVDLVRALALFESNGRYESARGTISNLSVARLFRFYAPLGNDEESEIWRKQKELRSSKDAEPVLVPDEQRVEDAGLELEAVLQNT